jgi:hypothetical protein
MGKKLTLRRPGRLPPKGIACQLQPLPKPVALRAVAHCTRHVKQRQHANLTNKRKSFQHGLKTRTMTAATEECRHALELYVQLNDDSEFSYVTDLQLLYDEARCFFLQCVLGKETKELVNSARISAVQVDQKFTWVNAKAETLRTLTDVTLTARFLAVARLRRQPGTAAKLWISQIFTRKALLEDPKLGLPLPSQNPSTWKFWWAKCRPKRRPYSKTALQSATICEKKIGQAKIATR